MFQMGTERFASGPPTKAEAVKVDLMGPNAHKHTSLSVRAQLRAPIYFEGDAHRTEAGDDCLPVRYWNPFTPLEACLKSLYSNGDGPWIFGINSLGGIRPPQQRIMVGFH